MSTITAPWYVNANDKGQLVIRHESSLPVAYSPFIFEKKGFTLVLHAYVECEDKVDHLFIVRRNSAIGSLRCVDTKHKSRELIQLPEITPPGYEKEPVECAVIVVIDFELVCNILCGESNCKSEMNIIDVCHLGMENNKIKF
jgi:hypothetical protein